MVSLNILKYRVQLYTISRKKTVTLQKEVIIKDVPFCGTSFLHLLFWTKQAEKLNYEDRHPPRGGGELHVTHLP